MSELRSYDRLLACGLVVLLLTVGVVSFCRAARGEFDFAHFYLDARHVWDHGELSPDADHPDPDQRRRLPFYLPFVAPLLAPLTAFGRVPAALVWSAAQAAALGYGLRVLWRWGRRDDDAPVTAAFVLATLLAVPAFIEAAKFNQLSFFVLALVLGGVRGLDHKRPWSAGALLGAAGAVKLLPVIFLPWLLLKRRWSAAGSFLLAAIVIALVPCLVAFGPHKTVEYHRQWWQYNVRGEAGGRLVTTDLREHFVDHRNQSIAQVLARLTWAEHPWRAPWQPLRLGKQTCTSFAYAIAAVLLAALLWVTRRPWRCLAPRGRRAEAAVYALGMLVFSPLLRTYYLVWAFPALVVLAQAADGGSNRGRRLGRIGLGVWVGGLLAWLSPIARLHGAHLAVLIALGLLVLWVTQERPASVNSVISGRQLKRNRRR